MKFLSPLERLAGGLAYLLIAASAASAQSYSLPWSTLDGGGGPSGGGSFALNGTLGQPDAGVTSGGSFTVSGGFWSGTTTISAGPLPTLSIRHGGGNSVILSWPNPSTGYVLQKTANLSAPSGGWTDVMQTPVVVGPNQEVMLPATGQGCLFRLRRL